MPTLDAAGIEVLAGTTHRSSGVEVHRFAEPARVIEGPNGRYGST